MGEDVEGIVCCAEEGCETSWCLEEGIESCDCFVGC